MPVFSVRHLTEYRYARPVAFGEHRLMFRPRDSHDQRLLHSALEVDPLPAGIRWIHDVFGNSVVLLRFARPAAHLRFETQIRLDHTPSSGPDFQIDDAARHYPVLYAAEDVPDLARSMERHHADPGGEVAQWARKFVRPGKPTETGHLLMTLCYAIRESFTYARRAEPGTQPPLMTLHLRRGTCRDFALFMMEAVRSLGFAARFVSGYIYVPDRDGAEMLGGGATHAWCQVYLPGAGWVEFDPTNGIVGNRDLIRVAVARTPDQAVPLSGSYHGLAGDSLGMDVQVNVTTIPAPAGASMELPLA
ncbi:transglutaminase family protein [Teichococcus oryzae]|uniref:Transglutaminase family protein n=1 Tax=Teichococcus oryzae TaxID=1608942 RepID=A0A5B2TFL6_9PROT|nr:transglutaminase family protein [Pseudoroseomonas oryzae]KAA2213271.1 transglutaminase family protein [Pseudoroseomonas oryzae]